MLNLCKDQCTEKNFSLFVCHFTADVDGIYSFSLCVCGIGIVLQYKQDDDI